MDSLEGLLRKLNNDLPGEIAHLAFYPYRRTDSYNKPEGKTSAIGIHIFPNAKDFYFYLIKRPTYKGYHSGQIAFPGGKQDRSDKSLVWTSRRESFEELGISMNKGELIKELTSVYIPVSNFIVHPFIFLHDEKPLINKNHEVEEVFEISIKALIEENNTCLTDVIAGEMKLKNIPAFKFDKCTVWGATALILNELKELLK